MNARLAPGDKAPDFVGMTPDGREVCLHDFLGRPVWLILYRYAGCPLCNLHLSEISLWLETFGPRDLELVTVFESQPDQFPRVIQWDGPVPLTLLSDPKKELYTLYGVEARKLAALHPSAALGWLRSQWKGHRQGPVTGELGQTPGHFLIDERGILSRVHYGSHIHDHIDWNEVKAFLSERTGVPDAIAL